MTASHLPEPPGSACVSTRRSRRARLRPFPPLPATSLTSLHLVDFGRFSFHSDCRDLATSFRAGPGWLGLGAGVSGLLRGLQASGLTPWNLCCESAFGLEGDLQSAVRRERTESLVRSGCLQGIYLRPGSGTFSSAVRPALRTKDFPLGVPDATLVQRGRLERGNLELSWVQQLCRLAESAGIFVILEHPQDSFFWRQEGWEPFSAASGWSDSFVDLCRFGAAFRKPTRLRVRGLFENIRLRCQCCEPHLVLRGRNRLSGTSWSMQGNERPKAFWDFLVQSVSDRLRKNRKIRLDVAGCAKTGSLRVGEAEHPGPRTRRVRAPQVLAAVSLVEPATAALRNKYWDAFGTWIESAAGPGAMLKFASASSEALGGLCSAPLRCRYAASLLQTVGRTRATRSGRVQAMGSRSMGVRDSLGEPRTFAASAAFARACFTRNVQLSCCLGLAALGCSNPHCLLRYLQAWRTSSRSPETLSDFGGPPGDWQRNLPSDSRAKD